MTDQIRPEAVSDTDLDVASGGKGAPMTDVILTSHSFQGAGSQASAPTRGGNSVAMETIELAVEKIERG